MEGPTRNEEYNALLVKWGQPGAPCDPECEECGDDLTDRDVIETPTNWLCQSCADKEFPDNEEIDFGGGNWPHGREDFHSDG